MPEEVHMTIPRMRYDILAKSFGFQIIDTEIKDLQHRIVAVVFNASYARSIAGPMNALVAAERPG
jgi:hypothetical protein